MGKNICKGKVRVFLYDAGSVIELTWDLVCTVMVVDVL